MPVRRKRRSIRSETIRMLGLHVIEDQSLSRTLATPVFPLNTNDKPMNTCYLLTLLLIGWTVLSSCQPTNEANDSSYPEGSFGFNVQFLQLYDNQLITLYDDHHQAGIVVSPTFQGKVFTSTAQGDKGSSHGWINYDLIAAQRKADHMNGYGGEDRFWLGPEGGQFSVFFAPGAEMTYDHWYTPAAIDTEPFEPVQRTNRSVELQKSMQLTNYAGRTLQIKARRTIRLLSAQQASDILQTQIPSEVAMVGYESENSIANDGDSAWTADRGTVCIWILGMFRPSPTTTAIIPYQSNKNVADGKVATTDYFGDIPDERLRQKEGVLFFKVDGRQRGKLGLSLERATGVAGSYDETHQTLTIIQYSLPKGDSVRYLNQRWEQSSDPYQGDVLNAYNDGPLEDGSQMGPFYELESSSPAAFLRPGETLTHTHRTFHFVGDEEALAPLVREILQTSLQAIKTAFQ